jgi:flavin reductase (DIM6/NTAB) family NADH-FMN oxidoreductase RutF
MSLQSVLEQYIKHIARLANKRPSVNRTKGLAWYTAAAERVQALLEAETPAWVGLEFKRSRIL